MIDLVKAYKLPESELRQFLETNDVEIDVDSSWLIYKDECYDISYGKCPIDHESREYAAWSVGRKLYYDFTVCGFLSLNEKKIYGETNITKCKKKIKRILYDKEVKANPEVIKAIKEADLIIFSSGSLLTSIIPNIIIDDVVNAIKQNKAPKLYICNLVTQPGETDDFKVSDHIKVLDDYLGKGVINMVLANNVEIPHELVLKYATEEQKDPVLLDESTLKKMKVKVIKDKIYTIEDGFLRHDTLKTAYLVFSILMENEK